MRLSALASASAPAAAPRPTPAAAPAVVLLLLLHSAAPAGPPLLTELLTDWQTNERRPLYDLEHGRRAIGYDPQQKSIVTEDFEAGRMEKDPVLHANL